MLSCFQKADIGDVLLFGEREYLVISSFDGYKVKAVNMETFRMDDICVNDIRYITKITKHSYSKIEPNDD